MVLRRAEMGTRTRRDFLVLDRHEDAKVISADVVKLAPSPNLRQLC